MKVSVRLVVVAVMGMACSSLASSVPAAPDRPAEEQPDIIGVNVAESVSPGSEYVLPRCPRGAQVLAGGVWTGAPALGAVIQASGPTGDRGWITRVSNVSGQDLDVTAYAICLTGTSPSQWVRTPSRALDSGRSVHPKRTTLSCPAGTRVVAGGLTTPPVHTDVGIVGLAPVDGPDNDKQRDDSVRLTYMVFERPPTQALLELTAECARDELAQGLTYVRKTKPVGPEGQVSVTARCPSGTRVLGGGFEGSDNLTQILASSMRPADAGDKDKKRDDAWQVVVDNYSASAEVTAYATCWAMP